mmetsp:Transcript_3653/g.6222  ORF Transcript_3653/g.6222 Transcript_3653/m.6222 type:complete len:91 (+) Transcript_3653:579-851(+)
MATGGGTAVVAVDMAVVATGMTTAEVAVAVIVTAVVAVVVGAGMMTAAAPPPVTSAAAPRATRRLNVGFLMRAAPAVAAKKPRQPTRAAL